MQSLHSIAIQIYDVVPHDETPTNYIFKTILLVLLFF